jgi:hypothetical protein
VLDDLKVIKTFVRTLEKAKKNDTKRKAIDKNESS